MATNISTVNGTDTVLRTENLNIYYGNFLAVRDIWLVQHGVNKPTIIVRN